MEWHDLSRLGAVALTNGTFDILHPGHLYALEFVAVEAVDADAVVVALDDDARVERLRGRPPVMPLEDRMVIVAALAPVDYVVSHGDGPGETLPDLMRCIRPYVWLPRGEPEILPFDEVDAANEVGARIVRIPRMGSWSSSEYRRRAVAIDSAFQLSRYPGWDLTRGRGASE